MKKIFISAFLTTCIALTSCVGFAQRAKAENKKSKEIIIRSNGDKDTKMKIEIDGDKITVDGKPLSEYHNGDVTITERDRVNRRSHDFLISPEDENMNFEFFNEDDKTPTAFLGVITEKAGDGVKINEVLKESSAEKAGLKNGDIITKVDDKNIGNPEDLMKTIRSHKPNDEVKVYYKRNDKKNDVKVKLGENKQQRRVRVFRNDNEFGDGRNYNFSMPRIPRLPNMPDTYLNYFRNDRVKMGVKVEDTQDNSGARILDVEAGSAADKAGLKKDDIITEMNGAKVNDIDDLRSELMEGKGKENYTLKAKRSNTLMSFDLKIPKPVKSADL